MGNNTFVVKDVTYRVMEISNEVRLESRKEYSKAFDEAISNGYKLHLEVQNMLKARGLFDMEANEQKLLELRKEVKDLEILLRKGVIKGKRMTKEQARDIALEIRTKRGDIMAIGRDVAKYFDNTAESYAENRSYQYCLYCCVVRDDNGKKVWDTFEDFLEDDGTNGILAEAIGVFSSMITGLDKDFDSTRYENIWLRKMGFVNDKGQMQRADGKLVDESGRLVNEEGRFIDEDGNFVDIFGNPIDEEGNLQVEDTWGVLEPDTKEVEPAIPPLSPE